MTVNRRPYKKELPESLLKVLKYVRDYQKRHNKSPIIREIAEAVGIGKSYAHRHLERLEEMGEIKRFPGHRGIRLMHQPTPFQSESLHQEFVLAKQRQQNLRQKFQDFLLSIHDKLTDQEYEAADEIWRQL